MKALLYCVKSKPYLHRSSIEKWWWNDGCYEPLDYREGFITLDKKPLSLRYKDGDNDVQLSQTLNGKIVAEVEIDKVEEIKLDRLDLLEEICKKSCLSHSELYEYLADFHIESNCMFYKKGYALHLKNLKVFDRPKDLSEYYLFDPDYCILKEVKKAPQNMCRVVESHELIEVPSKEYILISIQPQHLCNILNGEKTIEVRRKVLNCLKEMCKDE